MTIEIDKSIDLTTNLTMYWNLENSDVIDLKRHYIFIMLN